MELLLFLVLFSSLAYSVEQAKKEWRHGREHHASQIRRANPGWHPRKVSRHARLRSLGWWVSEAAEGFPAMRHAWAEDRDHVRYLRETERINRDTRLSELRAELGAIRRGREEHQADLREGHTNLTFGPWYTEQASRIRNGEPAKPAESPAPAPSAGSPVIGDDDPPGPTGPGPQPAPSADDAPTLDTWLTDVERSGTGPAPQAPGKPAGEPDHNDTEGDPMPTNTSTSTSVPNGELAGDSPYRAAFTALEGYDQVAQQHEQASETLEAQLTMHGFDRDPQLMEHIRGLRETAGQIRTRTESARQALVANHSQGDEYHRTGQDAEATAFRTS